LPPDESLQLNGRPIRRRQRSLKEPRIPISLFDVGVAIAISALGAATQASIGFGFALIAAPLLLLLHPDFVPGPLLATTLLLTFLMAYRERRAIDFHGVALALIGRASTTLPAALLVAALPRANFDTLFAGLIFLAVGFSIRLPRLEPTRALTISAGALSGVMGTVAAIGGPPMALLYQHAEGPRIRSSLSAFFLVGSALSLAALAAVGRFGAHELGLASILAPGVVLGFVASRLVSPWLDRGHMRALVLALSLAAGVAVLSRALA
jgi:uncharacterized membrane protein YfcA